jgi:hypothetical protein
MQDRHLRHLTRRRRTPLAAALIRVANKMKGTESG